MASLKELQTRVAEIPEFCQTELWPLVDKFNEEHKVDSSAIIQQVKTWGPLVVAGLLLNFLFRNFSDGNLKTIVNIIGSGAFFVGGWFIAKELVAFLKM